MYLVINNQNTVFAFRIPHTHSQTAFPQGLCFVTMRFQISESFLNPAAVNCSTALKAKMADVYAEINPCSTSFYFFYLFFSFHSSPPTLFLHHYHGSISCKVPSFSSFKSRFDSLQCIICSSLLLCYLSCMNQL